MNRKLFLKWLKINTLFFMGAFIVFLLLALLFPDTMLGFVRSLGAYGNSVSPTVLEPTSKTGLFVNILTRNSFMTILYFIASLFFLAPLIATLSGVFYSLGLMSAIDHFVKGEILHPLWSSPVLISIEVFFILLSITFASALATEIFGVKPETKRLWISGRRIGRNYFLNKKEIGRLYLKKARKSLFCLS